MTAAATPAPPPATAGGGATAARSPRSGGRRNSELGLLLFAMVLVGGYAAASEAALVGRVSLGFLGPLITLTAIFFAAHLLIRWLAPHADPVLLPAVAVVNGFGVMFLHRLDVADLKEHGTVKIPLFSGQGGRQLMWTLLAVICAVAVLAVVRDHRSLSRYAYTLGLAGIALMMIPAILPARFSSINGAKLWIRFGSFFAIQPGEFAKILLLVYFSYYLVRKREVLSLASKRILGIDFPRGRDLGPVLAVWLLSLMVLIFEKDLGTSLMYFGMFVVTLYVATERVSWLIIGLLLFLGGAFLAYFLGGTVGGPFANFYERADIWLHPFADPTNKGYQLVQSLLGLGTGGLFGSGPGAGRPDKVPLVQSDFIFAGMGEEIGLFGLTALLAVYLFIAMRGLRAAIGVRDSFGKLFAGGLSFTLGLQVFVIVGGVSKLIPLTGQTTPFMSAGGSSLVANWVLIALLVRISDAARRPADGSGAGRSGGPAAGGGPVKLQDLPTEMLRAGSASGHVGDKS
ncbi:FtsW/RodA/SpoVE family cell cycle protein [Planosporangium thailandense]|uniref:FtsW/RodA/SpoVE family cell cycle protein n=1 Tax=Planosporangium thailandense TaxID=765197 RepID=A0ABX0XRZ0_9ACTN|nr:FtsW/RodA/SpoVE family cell cycle protein [Planosporangium thailandense]